MQDYGCAIVEVVRPARIAKHDAAHGSFAVSDTEVGMAGAGAGEVGDFTVYPQVLKHAVAFQRPSGVR